MRSDSTRSRIAILSAAAVLAGCGLHERTQLVSSAAVQFPAPDDSLDYWDALESQPVTTNDDALHGLLMFAHATPHADTWEARVEMARSLGWIPVDGSPPAAEESAQMGFIAVCLCDVLQVQGGLSMTLFGPTPRYCTRELVHMGLLPGITEHEALTGAEFSALLAAAEQRQRVDEARAARAAIASAPRTDGPEAPVDAQEAATPETDDASAEGEPTQ